MKKNIFTFLLLLTTIITIGQINTIDKPPKKTWKILIKNSNNKEVNFQLIGQTIIDNDFSIEKKDVDYLTMETTPKVTERETSTYYLKFIAKDNLIILTGMGKSRINVSFANIEDEYSKIKNVGMNGSIAKDQFNAMLNFAKLFSENGNTFEFIVE
jgi:hypothetical protein